MIAQRLLDEFPAMNDAQRAIVGHESGPLLVIAGPGSGKTFSIVLRTLNLLLLEKATPGEIVLCTFTEKAAFELRDRVASAARKIAYNGDLTALRVGTIHGICNRFVLEFRHKTPLGSGYESLDDLTQLLFIFDHFKDILGKDAAPPFLNRWNTKWGAIAALRDYFNKITEELVDGRLLADDSNAFISGLGKAYLAYQQALFNENRVDFPHQQKLLN